MSQTSSNDVAKAFFRVAESRPRLHGAWIPVVYWASLVSLELSDGTVVVPKHLRSALKQVLNRSLTTNDSHVFGSRSVSQVSMQTKRVSHLRTSTVTTKDGTKKKYFLCVETKKKERVKLPDNDSEKTAYFKAQYNTFAAKAHTETVVILQGDDSLPIAEQEAVVNNSSADNEVAALDLAPIQAQEEAPDRPRVVTPTNEDVDATIGDGVFDRAVCSLYYEPKNADIMKLLDGIISPSLLEDSTDDLFVEGQSSVDKLRCRVKRLGFVLHKKEVQEQYNKKYEQQPTSFKRKDISTLDPKKYSLLTERHGVPLSVPAVQDLTRAIHKLSSEVPEVLQTKDGRPLYQRAICPSSNETRLYANAKSWMNLALLAAIEEGSSLTKADAVSAFARVLSTIDEGAFGDVCDSKMNALKLRPKMTPDLQKGLLYDASLSSNQFELIRKYTIVTLGYNLWQPVSKVKELDVPVYPTTLVPFVEDKKKKRAHYRPIDKAFKWSVDNKLAESNSVTTFNRDFDVKRICKCHIVFGGDHGQKAFRMVATILFFVEGTVHKYDVVLELDVLCGFIECTKDTYDVLARSIAKPLNASLKRTQGRIFFCKEGENTVVSWGNSNSTQAVVHSVEVELFAVGDYKFLMTIQGRGNYASNWCCRCQWGKGAWQTGKQKSGKKKGEKWTLVKLCQRRCICQQIVDKGTKLDNVKPIKRKGVTPDLPPLFDAIPIENYLTPILHAVDLFANSAKALLDAYIDHRLEDRPIEIMKLRWREADQKRQETMATFELESAKQYLLDATALGDPELINEAKEAIDDAQVRFDAAKKGVRDASAAARKLESKKDYGALSQGLRQQVDSMLETEFHILRSSYHGGDYEGNHCRKLMRNAVEVMARVEEMLKAVPSTQRAAGCDDAEIHKYCTAFARLFQYFDVLSHYCYQPYGTITDSEMITVRDLVAKMDRLWRKLAKNTPVKAHCWWHLVDDLERLRGMLYHHESKIELAHQKGRQAELRFRAMAGNKGKRVAAEMRFEANSKDPAVLAAQAEVQQQRARNFTKPNRWEEEKEAKRHKRVDNIHCIVLLPEIDGSFPTLLELAALDQEIAGDRLEDTVETTTV